MRQYLRIPGRRMSSVPTSTRSWRWPRWIRIRTVPINCVDRHAIDFGIPFGGHQHSGSGREWRGFGFGFGEYLETMVIVGCRSAGAAD